MGQKIAMHDTKYYGKDELTWISIDGKPELMNLISQGYENIMTWVGHLIQRLYDIQPNTHYTNLVDIPAIVFIDEIDTYLHISVQQKILAVLVEKFPNIQFIVTTHSPYVLGSIPKDKIKIYVCNKEEESVEITEFNYFTAYGADVKQLTQLIYKTPTRGGTITINGEEVNIATVFADVRNALQRSNFDKADDLIEKLNKSGIDSDDPELNSLQSLIRTKKRMAGI